MPDIQHPQSHPAVKRRKSLPPVTYEIGAAVTAGWLVFAGTSDWKQGVGAALLTMFGGGIHRAGRWYSGK